MLVGDDVLDRVDRRPEEIRFARKDFRPFIEWLGSEDLVELTDQTDSILGARPTAGPPPKRRVRRP